MSAAVVGKSFQPTLPLKMEEEVPSSMVTEKKGIVSILGSYCERNKAASLRRTLSADMSSKKWLAQNGLRPMKKIASSEELAISNADHSSSTSSEDEDELQRPGQDEVWRSIQSQRKKSEVQKPYLWTWGSILTQKNEDSNDLPPPYIHPLVKRSASSLSEKSLEICTESLGSETGSDGFSSYPPSEAGDVDEEKEDVQQDQEEIHSQTLEESKFVMYNFSANRKVPPRSFPPPLPSLGQEDGASLHMHCHRRNGRLVLEAVSVPSQNYFHAQRQDGRLLLTLLNNPSSKGARNEEMEDKFEEYTQVFDDMEESERNETAEFEDYGTEMEDEEEQEELEMEEKFEDENSKRGMEFVFEQHSELPGGVINVHNPALAMKKLVVLDNKNLTWPPKFNKAVNLIDAEEVVLVEDEPTAQLPQSLPPRTGASRRISVASPPAVAASFNSYEYFWRERPSVASIIKPISERHTTLKDSQNKVILASDLKRYEQQNLVVMRGNKAEYLVPLLRRCNEQRRSLLLLGPHCIATS